MLYNFLLHGLAYPLAWFLFHPTLRNLDHVPAEGALILAGNHLGTGETFIIPAYVSRPVSMTAKLELFQKKTLWGRFSGWFLKLIDTVPVNRAGGQDADGAIRSTEHVLAEGGVVAISPEGKRSPDGRLYKFHTGVARMALDSGAPVLPYSCRNTRFRKGWLPWPWLYHPEITFGELMVFDEATRRAYREAPDRETSGRILREVTEEIRMTIQRMTGQEYVDQYAGRAPQPVAPR
jgi:1-acyl-sn-glycerol-3-phosphate acyltransferase